MKKSIVYVKIPRAGLGNCLLVWAHGLVFSKLNDLEIVTSRWNKFRWGALVRKEKKHRFYFGYFGESSLLKRSLVQALLLFCKVISNPKLGKIESLTKHSTIYLFDKLPAHPYFADLGPYLGLIKQSFNDLLSEKVKKELKNVDAPEIGVHIRRGDFKIANYITPITYFIEIIKLIRGECGADLSVTLFTDAYKEEIKEIFDLGNVKMSENRYDVSDLVQLSKSKFILLSKDSSFGYWAAFLSSAVVFIHPDDWHKTIKNEDGSGYKEVRNSEGNTGKVRNLLKQVSL